MERLAVEPTLRLPGGSENHQQLRREAAMAAELVASGHGDALVRCGVAWLPARTVIELFGDRQRCEAAGSFRSGRGDLSERIEEILREEAEPSRS
jgi:hypothetical protein